MNITQHDLDVQVPIITKVYAHSQFELHDFPGVLWNNTNYYMAD